MKLVDAERLAWRHMKQHSLVEYGWTFDFDQSYKRFGACYYHRKHISLSVHLVLCNDEPAVLDTILHEIAHALAGWKAAHGPEWKEVCVQIGAKPQQFYSSEDVVVPQSKLIGHCPAGHKFARQTFPKYQESCGRCDPKYNPEHKIIYTKNEQRTMD